MSKQLYEIGDVIQAGSSSLEVTGVTYSEPDGTPESRNYTYLIRPHAEVEAERQAEIEHQKALEEAAKEAEKAEAK